MCLACRIVIVGLNCWPQLNLERANSLLTSIISMQYIALYLCQIGQISNFQTLVTLQKMTTGEIYIFFKFELKITISFR